MKTAAFALGISGGILAILCALAAGIIGGVYLLLLSTGDAVHVPSSESPFNKLDPDDYNVLIPCILGFTGGIAGIVGGSLAGSRVPCGVLQIVGGLMSLLTIAGIVGSILLFIGGGLSLARRKQADSP